MANLRLDETEGLFVDRGGYHIIVPGNSTQSKLYQKISSKSDSFRMPPVWSGRTLTEKQIGLIKEWIDEGAKWESVWSFVPPKRPPVPVAKEQAWPRNPIDNFVLARLEAEGLKPSPETDKATLLRRLYFDLIGLPPSPAEIDAFLADHSADGYEKRVDKLLASSHYGERMALPWLDLARYADTHGYHQDTLREMWRWRDWVIQAFNQNMPFDEFTIEQIAGDLLPHATLGQKVASGFNRNHMLNNEGGAIPAEYHLEYLVDRVSTTSTAWLGLTMGCARCHDHKYDPIKQKDFYRFLAFFNTVPERGLDGFGGNAAPLLPLPSHDQQEHLDALKTKIARTLSALPEKEILAQRNEWQKTAVASIPEPSRHGLMAYYPFDGDLKDASDFHHDAKVVRGEILYDEGAVAQGADFSAETRVNFGTSADLERSKPFTLAFWTQPGMVAATKILQKRTPGEYWQGWEVADENPTFETPTSDSLAVGANFVVRLANHWPDDAVEVMTKERQTFDALHHLLVEYDGSGKASGLKFYIDGKPVETRIEKDQLSGEFHASASMEIGDKDLGISYKGLLDDLRIYDCLLNETEVEDLAKRVPARALLTTLDGRPTQEILPLKPEQEAADIQIGEINKAKTKQEIEGDRQARLTEYFLSDGASERVRRLYAQLKNLREEKKKLDKSVPTLMIMAEMKKPRETFVMGRGQYDNPQEKVTPGVPSFLPPMAPGLPMNRLGLAKWLVDPGNPLTARVAVNHFWQEYFGIGIVKTSEDFGSQGEPPSNQPLLDWLATEFIRSGWNVKAMQRLIVTSATYRQSSEVTPELEERDPENRLLARGPRFRLPAELIRDNALAIAGLIDLRIGGPSAYPYQPKGLWEEMATGFGFSGQSYMESTGRDLYRRSMYTIWKRTVPPPALVTFDAPDREKCTARRTITNTPLQALVLMNDPTYVEAARLLARRMLTEGGKTAQARINFAFRLALGRLPDAQERTVLSEAEQAGVADYRVHTDQAAALLRVGVSQSSPRLDPQELAAWTIVASMILNLDETITKE